MNRKPLDGIIVAFLFVLFTGIFAICVAQGKSEITPLNLGILISFGLMAFQFVLKCSATNIGLYGIGIDIITVAGGMFVSVLIGLGSVKNEFFLSGVGILLVGLSLNIIMYRLFPISLPAAQPIRIQRAAGGFKASAQMFRQDIVPVCISTSSLVLIIRILLIINQG